MRAVTKFVEVINIISFSNEFKNIRTHMFVPRNPKFTIPKISMKIIHKTKMQKTFIYLRNFETDQKIPFSVTISRITNIS